MNKQRLTGLILPACLALSVSTAAFSATTVGEFQIEGLISPASVKALKTGLTKENLKVVNLELKDTAAGWPVIHIEFDSAKTSKEQVEKIISSIEDPAGHKYGVHKGPLLANAPLIEEEKKAQKILGTSASTMKFQPMKNPIAMSQESSDRGSTLYLDNCSKCHGVQGNGYGPVMQGFMTPPSQLFRSKSLDDSYLFGMITYGRTDMPPWGLILSDEERWDLVNYIKTFKTEE